MRLVSVAANARHQSVPRVSSQERKTSTAHNVTKKNSQHVALNAIRYFTNRKIKSKFFILYYFQAIQSGGVTYKNEPWHRDCFTCTHCEMKLAGQRFTSRDDKPCCAECFGKLFAKRCTLCNEPITGIGGTRFISFEDRHWHNQCFICADCKTTLVGRGFITDAEKIICPECAKERFM